MVSTRFGWCRLTCKCCNLLLVEMLLLLVAAIYIQMECAASLVINKLNVTVVFQRPIAVSDVLNTFIYSIFSFELLIERLWICDIDRIHTKTQLCTLPVLWLRYYFTPDDNYLPSSGPFCFCSGPTIYAQDC